MIIFLTKEEVISALGDYVANKLCYSRKPLKDITINQITMKTALHVSFIKG